MAVGELVMKAREFLDYCRKKKERHGNTQKLGRYLINELWDYRPDLYHKVVWSAVDPFYLDSKIPAFEEFVIKNWGEG
jgi:hypothetical protein